MSQKKADSKPAAKPAKDKNPAAKVAAPAPKKVAKAAEPKAEKPKVKAEKPEKAKLAAPAGKTPAAKSAKAETPKLEAKAEKPGKGPKGEKSEKDEKALRKPARKDFDEDDDEVDGDDIVADDLDDDIEADADAFLTRYNFKIGRHGEQYRDLCHKLMRAEIEQLQRYAERDQGNYTGQPADPIVIEPPARDNEDGAAETIMGIFTKYERENPNNIRPESFTQARRDVQHFADFVGPRVKPGKIERRHVREWKELLAEFPVAIVDKVADEHGTRDLAKSYLDFLYTPEGQKIEAEFSLRVRDEKVAAEFKDKFPPVKLVTVEDVFGGWPKVQAEHFAEGGLLDQVYGSR